MTTLEKAARIALEKMEHMVAHGEWYAPEQAIAALRQALEQPKLKPLTDEEICEMADATPVGEMADADTWHIRFARAIEAKLKERNA